MATALEVASARLQNADVAIEAAKATGLPLALAFALLDMESEGRNFFGSDAGGMYKGQAVTKAKFETMEKAVAEGGPSNGVGPTQVTHRSFFPAARARGLKLWEPYDNMVFGFGLLAGYYKRYPTDLIKVGRLYNGKESYGITFKRVVGEWEKRLAGAEEGTMDWHLAPSFKTLQGELDDTLGANRPNDGTIGDQAHAARESEHNPDDDADSMPRGAVSALDVYTYANGKTWITAAEFTKFLALLKKDSRVWYVIHKGYIYSRTHGFEKRKYEGSNPHTNHIHISLVQTKAAHDDTSSWGVASIKGTKPAEPKPPTSGVKTLPVLSKGDSHNYLVPFLQRFFGLRQYPDRPVFGKAVDTAVRRYQRMKNLEVDGVVGEQTWKAIVQGVPLPGWKP